MDEKKCALVYLRMFQRSVKVLCKEIKNTTSLLSVDSVVNKTTCFGLLGGHHQVQQVLAIVD